MRAVGTRVADASSPACAAAAAWPGAPVAHAPVAHAPVAHAPVAHAPVAGTRALSLARTLARLVRLRIQFAVLLSLLPTLALEGGAPAGTIVALGLGTLLTGACCDAFNAAWEAPRDALMARTRARPIPSGELAPGAAFAASALLGVSGLLLLARAGGMLAAGIGLAAIAVYVLLYTIWLKPRSPLAAILGGASGCVGPLLADACDGRLGAAGWLPFLVLFAWTPPHVWAIACWRFDDYARAGFRCLPVSAGRAAARLWGLPWLALVVVLSVIPFAALGSTALVAAVLLLDAALVIPFLRAVRSDDAPGDRRAFLASVRWLSAWLLLLFVAALIVPA